VDGAHLSFSTWADFRDSSKPYQEKKLSPFPATHISRKQVPKSNIGTNQKSL